MEVCYLWVTRDGWMITRVAQTGETPVQHGWVILEVLEHRLDCTVFI